MGGPVAATGVLAAEEIDRRGIPCHQHEGSAQVSVRWAAGTLTWTWSGGSKSSIGYQVTGSDDWLIATLHYRWCDKEDVNIRVHLDTTPTQFGGRRFWFICPLIVRGSGCKRRAGKLYLPPGRNTSAAASVTN